MADRPIIFSAAMVRALLSGRKTQTRRILKPQPVGNVVQHGWDIDHESAYWTDQEWNSHPLRFWVGDRLWVKENHRLPLAAEGPAGITKYGPVFYEADRHWYLNQESVPGKLRPSIHMPRWASRMTLVVTDVQVQRLQDIGDKDSLAEGIFAIRGPDKDGMRHFAAGFGEKVTRPTPTMAFEELWRAINGPDSWDANPWVVAVSFEKHGAIDSIGK